MVTAGEDHRIDHLTPDQEVAGSISAARASCTGDFLEGAEAIAAFLTSLGFDFNIQRVYNARHNKTLPIRRDRTLGVYASRTELLAHLTRPETLTTPES